MLSTKAMRVVSLLVIQNNVANRGNRMKKYHVIFPLYVTLIYKIEAETKEEAFEKSYKMGPPSLLHQCSDEIEIGEYGLDSDPIVEEA